MTDHIYRQVTEDLRQLGYEITDWFRKPRYHQPQPQGAAMNNLVETIKQDFAALVQAGHTAEDALHNALTKRLGIVSVLNHAADEMARLQASPLAPIVERYIGLPPAVASTVVHVVDVVAQDAAALLAGPQPEPAQPAA